MLEGNARTLCGRERPGSEGGVETMPSEVMCSYEGACSTEIPAMSECKCSPESGCIEIGKGSGHWRSGRRLHLMAIAVQTTTIRSCAGMSCTHTYTQAHNL